MRQRSSIEGAQLGPRFGGVRMLGYVGGQVSIKVSFFFSIKFLGLGLSVVPERRETIIFFRSD